MEPASEIVLRNESRLPVGDVLLVNPPRDTLGRHFQSSGRKVCASTQNHGDFQWLSSSGISASFDVVPLPRAEDGLIILNLPRERELLAMMLHALSSRMQEGARLWLVGENRAGIKSAGKRLSEVFRNVVKLDSARHCGLFEASEPLATQPFALSDYQLSWTVQAGETSLEVISLPGVFAHGRLDKGSQLLLHSLKRLAPTGRVLDFACGSGVIGCSLLASRQEMELTLLDVSALAIESSRLTLARNGLEAGLVSSDGLAGLSGTFDWIVSNPPFHRGVQNDLDIASHFFGAAGTFLAKNGRIVIVCNRHLPYTGWLQSHFEHVNRLDENSEFIVLQADKPRKRQE